jgi:glucose-1-phosphate cytidylyltransferase
MLHSDLPAQSIGVKTAILAGGLGTRFLDETRDKPKPMVEIGGRPILWHIMRYYAHFGHADFVVALGYRGDVVRGFFDSGGGDVSWRVRLADTGPDTSNGGRLLRLRPELGEATFFLTWGDGLSDVDLVRLLAFHRSHGKLATLTAVHPPSRFGELDLEGDRVERFREKPRDEQRWINGAFFVLEPGIFDYIVGDDTVWEREPLERLAAEGQLMAYRHEGFWQCMDTSQERDSLESLWASGQAPWKVWQ